MMAQAGRIARPDCRWSAHARANRWRRGDRRSLGPAPIMFAYVLAYVRGMEVQSEHIAALRWGQHMAIYLLQWGFHAASDRRVEGRSAAASWPSDHGSSSASHNGRFFTRPREPGHHLCAARHLGRAVGCPLRSLVMQLITLALGVFAASMGRHRLLGDLRL
jgi:hypothetical protein